MNYQIALSPELGLTPADFVQEWNATETSRVVAEARVQPTNQSQFDPFLEGVIAVVSTVGVGVVTNALYDLIKQLVVKRTGHKHIHVSQVDQPDGTHILVIDLEEN